MDYSHQFLTNNLVLPLWNDQSLEVIDHYFSKTVDVRTTFLSGTGVEVLKKNAQSVFEVFPDLQIKIDEIIQLDKQYVYKWTGNGSHKGTLMGLKPTGNQLQFSGVVYAEMEEGTVITYHSFSDIPKVFQNLSTTLPNVTFDISSKEMQASLETLHCSLKKLTRFPLTRREIECLIAWIRGCTIKETAKRMGGLSERTIQTYRENIKKKFEVFSYQQVLHVIKKNGFLPHFF